MTRSASLAVTSARGGASKVVIGLRETTPAATRKHLTVGGKPSALVIGEPRPAAVQLLTQYPILLFEIVDHLELLPVDLAGEDQEQELQRLDNHRAASYRAANRLR